MLHYANSQADFRRARRVSPPAPARAATMLIAAVLAGLLLATGAQGQESTQPASSPATTAPTTLKPYKSIGESPQGLKGSPTSDMLWNMLASVVIILVLGGACLFLIKRVLPRINRPSGRTVRVLETSYLGPQKMIHLVHVGSRKFLLASSKDTISVIADVTAALETDDELHSSQGGEE